MTVHELPDSPGYYADTRGNVRPYPGTLVYSGEDCTPTLDEIITDLCSRVGLTADQIDVTYLTDEVLGYRIANETGADTMIGPLMSAFMFDVAEWDGKVRFVKRGQASSFAIGPDDLVEREGDAFESERVQEAELLRKVTVGYLDPATNYAPTTQNWERRSATVQAKGESAIEMPLVADADFAAQAAEKCGKVAWSETDKHKFSLTTAWTKLTPTDVGTYTDSDGNVHRMRLMGREDESGELMLEAVKDRQAAYTGTVSGVGVPPVIVPPPRVLGPSILRVLQLPASQAGVYVAVTGLVDGWPGAAIYVSVDGGVSETNVLTAFNRATIGELVTGIDADDEPITVDLYDNRTLSSVTTAQVTAGLNKFALVSSGVAEIAQFETATANGDNYDLTTVTRAVDGTTAASHAAGADFVLLDAAIYFIPISADYAGDTLIFRAVTLGTSADDNPDTVSIVYEPPTYIRDGGVVTP